MMISNCIWRDLSVKWSKFQKKRIIENNEKLLALKRQGNHISGSPSSDWHILKRFSMYPERSSIALLFASDLLNFDKVQKWDFAFLMTL